MVNKYCVKFWTDNPRGTCPDYIITIDADDPDTAVEKATVFLMENAWWPGLMTDDQKRKHLSDYEVEEVVQ